MSLNIALLRKAVDWAEEEQNRKNRTRHGAKHHMRKGEHTWYQKLWAQVHLNDKARKESPRVWSKLHDAELMAVNPLSCGSTGCIAGHICVLAGDNYLVSPSHMGLAEIPVDFVMTKEGEVVSIGARAQDLLGVHDPEKPGDGMYDLFSGGNSIEKVRAVADMIARDHGEVL